MPKTIHFKSNMAYRKWLAFKNIHHLKHGEHYENVVIRGKPHKVVHSYRRKSSLIHHIKKMY